MRVVVVGGGVVGVCAAYELLRSGHEVTVIDRAAAPGDGATAGNAGIVTAGDAIVWASARELPLMLRALVGRHPSMRVQHPWRWPFVRWAGAFALEALPRRNRHNTRANWQLARFSQDCLEGTIASEALDVPLARSGIVLMFADEPSRAAAASARDTLRALGQIYQPLDLDALVQLEPYLAKAPRPPHSGILLEGDGSASAELFTRELWARCEALGAAASWSTTVHAFTRAGGRVTGLDTSAGPMEADRYVVALGHESSALAATAGDRLVMMPATGYSITAPIVDPAGVPRLAGVDERHHVAFSVSNDLIRLSSSAVVGKGDRGWCETDLVAIRRCVEDLMPGGADWGEAEPRARARPVMARNRPVIGRGIDPSVYYATGHGHLGWTQAAGSGRLLAALIDGLPPPIDPTPYALPAVTAIGESGGRVPVGPS
jgi:D-amino-acid dehydrogenase